MAVYLIGTLDTKGREVAFVRELLTAAGVDTVTVDAGCLGEAPFTADISREEVFSSAGSDLAAVQQREDRGYAIQLAADGIQKIAEEAWQDGRMTGILGLGGSAGTTIATAAMRALPLHIPKLMVSTLASGQTRPYVGGRNIVMLNSVVDIAGINRISRTVLSQAAQAMIGMLQPRASEELSPEEDRPLIAATMFGVTTPCVLHAQKILEQAGYEVLVFHATGSGGESMERLIRDGLIAGVLDITTTELADELVGGVLSAGPDRLTAAAEMGIPQVISVGALDMVNFGPRDSVPDKFRERTFYEHNASVTLMRTTLDECQQLGEEIGRKATAATGPTSILFPSLGVSAIDVDGKPFDNWAARMALWHGLQSSSTGSVELKLLQHTINDDEFAEAAAAKLLALMNHAKE